MSIETERWRRRPGRSYGSAGVDIVRVEHADGGREVETWVADTDYPEAVEVLPEALALLKEYWKKEGLPEDGDEYGKRHHERLEDILRRAGVLGA